METLLPIPLVVLGFAIVQVLVIQPLFNRQRRTAKLRNIQNAMRKIPLGSSEVFEYAEKHKIAGQIGLMIGDRVDAEQIERAVESCFSGMTKWATMLNKDRRPEEARKVECLMSVIMDIT